MILAEAGALVGVFAMALVAATFIIGDPHKAVPTVVVSFTDARGHVAPTTGQGETGAHALQLKIDPAFAPYLEAGPYGPLPKIAANGDKPAKRFARTRTPSDAGSIVSVVVSGLGLNEQETRDAINRLPPEVTLAFSPYSRSLGSLTELARRSGHEFLIEVPLEPFDYPQSDPGPLVLLVDAPQSSNLDRLHRTMGESVGYIGLLTTGRARFATSEAAIAPIASEAEARGLMILDDGRAPVSKMPRITRQVGTLAGTVDRRLDDRPSADGMALALIEFERLAVEQGRAIGALDLFPVGVDRLIRWTTTLKAKGLVLEPVSVQVLPPELASDGAKSKSKKSDHEHRDAERH